MRGGTGGGGSCPNWLFNINNDIDKRERESKGDGKEGKEGKSLSLSLSMTLSLACHPQLFFTIPGCYNFDICTQLSVTL